MKMRAGKTPSGKQYESVRYGKGDKKTMVWGTGSATFRKTTEDGAVIRKKTGKTPGGRFYSSQKNKDGSRTTTVNPIGRNFTSKGERVQEHMKITSPNGKSKKYATQTGYFSGPPEKIKKSFITKRTPRNGDF